MRGIFITIISMVEFITEAVVLDKADAGEQDARISLYTKDCGKLTAKTKSLRKITSKLAGHLQPLNLVMARLVEKNGVQLVDALTLERRLPDPKQLKSLFLIKELAAEGQPDPDIWEAFQNPQFFREPAGTLALLGFDPAFAKCNYCQAAPKVFYPADFYFYCEKCSPPGAYVL